MVKEIEYVLEAVKAIKVEYYKVSGVMNDNEIDRQPAENAYTAELFHQLRCMQDLHGIWKKHFGELKWDFDLTKPRFGQRRPDLILHYTPEDRTDQRIYIEVKTSSISCNASDSAYKNHIKDIRSLKLAVEIDNGEEHLGFSYGIFIVGNISLGKLKDLIASQNISSTSKSKLYLIYFDSNSYDPKCIAFSNLNSIN